MNTKEQGQITESRFVFECSKLGLGVSRPIGDTAPYDFIVDYNGSLYKVQCKSMYKSDGAYIAQTHKKVGHRRTGKQAYHGLADIFFFYNPEDDVFVYLSVKDAPKTTVNFRKESRLNGSRLVKDHTDLLAILK